MRGSTRLLKRLIALFLVVLMSIDAFAAVVGDNDGAAFITKAEFDSMKTEFQSQLDRYNSSIDNKIDGAISSYLAGVKIAKQSELVNLVAESKEKSIYNISFVKWEAPNAGKDVPDVEAACYWKYVNRTARVRDEGRKSRELYGGLQINNGSTWGGGFSFQRYHNYTEPESNYNSAYYLVEFPFGEKNFEIRKTEGNTSDFIINSTKRQRCHFYLFSVADSWNDSAYCKFDESEYVGVPSSLLNDFSVAGTGYEQGPKVGRAPQSSNIFFSWINLTPAMGISHVWWIYTTDTGRANQKLDYMYAWPVSGTSKGIDFNFRDSYVSDNQLEYPIAYAPYSDTAQGGKSGYWVFMDAARENPEESGKYWCDNLATLIPGARVYDNRLEFRFKWNRQKIYDIDWTKMTHKYYNDKYTEAYYKYNGIPICRTLNKPGKLKFKLKFTNKVLTTGATVSPSTANYTYAITDKKFKNGNLPTMTETDSYYRDSDGYNHVLKRETRNTGAAEWTTDWIELDKTKITDTNNGDYIYIKISPNNADQVVSVEVVDSITYTED